MGLFSSWGSMLSPAPQTDAQPQQNPLVNYNDSVAQAKVDRSRAIAKALTQQALEKQQQGSFFHSGDFTGYTGGATLGSALMQGLTALAGNKMADRANEQQQQQGQDQVAAMMLRQGIDNGSLDANGNPVQSPTDKANADALQAAVQLNQSKAPVDGLKPGSQQLPTNLASPADVSLPDVSNIPAPEPQAPTATPGTPPPTVSPQAVKAAQLLGAGGGRGGQGGPTAAEASDADTGTLHQLAKWLSKPTMVPGPAPANGPHSLVTEPDPQTELGGLLPPAGGLPMMRPNLQGAQPAPQAQPAPAPQGPMPAPVQQPALPSISAPAPAQAQQTQPAPADPTMAPMQVPQLSGPGFATPAQIAANTPAPTTPQQQLADHTANLFKLAQTGPQGQMLATAELNQIYGNKNGRYTTTVHADPVNGGFVQVVTDTATGRTQSSPLTVNAGNKGAFTETTDAQGNRMKVYKNGSPAEPVLDANGQPVKDASVIKSNDEQKLKTGQAVVANQSARSAIDSSLARLDRIEQLYKETETGPIAGMLPNWTAKRQELHALLAQDIFAETRDAVAGAADAGGAPRMAQSEFKYMANNGGLSQETKPDAAANIIAQQRLRLNALRGTLSKHAETLGGIQDSQGTSSGQSTGNEPWRAKWLPKN